jgi:flavodoxin
MVKRCLIIYQSLTGNTEKVALRFKSTFERNGWECDTFKINKNTDITTIPSVKYFDFLCVGSPVHSGLPPEELRKLMDVIRSPGKLPSMTLATLIETMKKPVKVKGKPVIPIRATPHRRITTGPKKGVVFVTGGFAHFGLREAEPALIWLASEMEHAKFKCIGSFCCPGKMPLPKIKGRYPSTGYFKDLQNRPNEKDLLKAEMFIEDILVDLG